MNKVISTVGALIVAALLQVAIVPHLAIGGVVPNVLLLIVLTLALLDGPRAGALSGFSAGLIFDLLGTGPIGPGALVLLGIGFLAGSLSEQMFAEGWRAPVIVVFVGSLLTEIAYAIVVAMLGLGAPFFSTFMTVMLPAAVYNFVLALLAYPLLTHFLRRERSVTTFGRID